jgi:hypothetical protein
MPSVGDLAADPRFSDHASIVANSVAAVAALTEAFASATLEEWRERLDTFDGLGQWCRRCSRRRGIPRPSPTDSSKGARPPRGVPFTLVAPPVQFDEERAKPSRAPEFNEHGDALLANLGLDWDTVLDLKIRGRHRLIGTACIDAARSKVEGHAPAPKGGLTDGVIETERVRYLQATIKAGFFIGEPWMEHHQSTEA